MLQNVALDNFCERLEPRFYLFFKKGVGWATRKMESRFYSLIKNGNGWSVRNFTG